MMTQYEEHPFAAYIRILGKGKRGSRSLTQDEAYQAMRMILTDQTEAVQLGAFLMLLRVKEESPQELAGFVQAAQASLQFPTDAVDVDLDWSSYAGKRRHLPWFLLTALLLAENGIRVFMHGAGGHTAGRIYTHDVLKLLGLRQANSCTEAAAQIRQHRFSYLALRHLCPKLHEIIELRPKMGLRSPVHSLSRMLNPFAAPFSIQGIFHPGYRPVHQQAALLLKQPHTAVLKGEGGEIERNPDVKCLVQSVHDDQLFDEEWPAKFKRRHIKPDVLDAAKLPALWNGGYQDEYAEATVLGTAAVVLKFLRKADSQEQAEALAADYWCKRNKDKYQPSIITGKSEE